MPRVLANAPAKATKSPKLGIETAMMDESTTKKALEIGVTVRFGSIRARVRFRVSVTVGDTKAHTYRTYKKAPVV